MYVITKQKYVFAIFNLIIIAFLSACSNEPEPDLIIPEGALCGVFQVGDSTYVRFSKGNLQYNAKSNVWRFADNQWSVVGEPDYLGNVFENGIPCSNDSISPTYGGWIDLFGWGTSGWNSGANCYEPWSTSQKCEDYYIGGDPSIGMIGDYYMADWGSNPIVNGGNTPGLWRTLTHEEWVYLHNHYLMFFASIDKLPGIMIISYLFNAPEDMIPYNLDFADPKANPRNALWGQRMEECGAVFLPITGSRHNNKTLGTTNGYYWSASPGSGQTAYSFEISPKSGFDFDNTVFSAQHIRPSGSFPFRFDGYAVRLVQDVSKDEAMKYIEREAKKYYKKH